jgi:hypothetical protein
MDLYQKYNELVKEKLSEIGEEKLTGRKVIGEWDRSSSADSEDGRDSETAETGKIIKPGDKAKRKR